MTDTNVLHLSQPGTFADPLTEVLCNGARALLAQAVEAEVATFLSQHADELSNGGRRRLVQDPRPALLGAQDRQPPQQAAEEPATESQARTAGDLDG